MISKMTKESLVIHLELNSNWGCQNQIGFTGIEFIHKNGQPINVKDHATITSTTVDTSILERHDL